ncbi:ParB/RepB/Spo0J family partition protein [Mycobacterium heidelbergense]|uniref:ParB/RepB/Spo0J family partition protein n=1 Tax=Mycobacterium heidelbergense TaxID=53376 RepID=UPI003CED6188
MTERGQRRVGTHPETPRPQTIEGPPHQHQRRGDTVVSLRHDGFGEDPDPNRIRTLVKIASLVGTGSPRSRGESEAHVQRLVEAEWPLPPILVHRPTMRIIDGHHRVAAARRKRFEYIDAYLVNGSEESAFIVAVQENVVHGLPLSLADRRAAAARILRTHTHWSDRAIATATGLSAKTVGAIRRATEENQQSHNRLGKDGRVRPLNATAGRQVAAELLSSQTGGSLREIARAAGISLSTVRDVRDRLRRGEDPVPAPGKRRAAVRQGENRDVSPGGRPTPPLGTLAATDESAEINRVLLALSKDPALRMNAAGRELLRWLHLHAVSCADSRKIPESVPDHCVDHLIELARHCSASWAMIARDWSQRSRTRPQFSIEVAN